MEKGNFIAHREWHLINLEFSLFFSERMWLHYSLLCRCHSFSVVASPSLVSILKTASALSCQKTAKLYWRLSSALMLIYSESLRCYGIVWKHHSSPPHPLCFSSSLPNIFLHLQRQMKPNAVCCVLGAKFISNVDGAHSGIMSWLPKTIKPRPRDCRLKWCCTEHHHHHNLERPSLAEKRESRGPNYLL